MDRARHYVEFLADRLGIALSDDEFLHAAGRSVAKQAELEPLYEAVQDAPVEGVLTFRPDAQAAPGRVGTPIDR